MWRRCREGLSQEVELELRDKNSRVEIWGERLHAGEGAGPEAWADEPHAQEQRSGQGGQSVAAAGDEGFGGEPGFRL